MTIQVRRQGRVIGIQRRMQELGVIRFGETATGRGGKTYPRALDKFRLTSASKTLLEAAGGAYGIVKPGLREWADAPNPGMWEVYLDTAELTVMLPPITGDDGTPTYPFSQAWELWAGSTCQRRCDGMVATVPKGAGLTEVECLCDPDKRACDIYTRFSVMLPDLPGIGLWRLNTSGKYAAAELPGTLQLLTMAAARQQYLRCTLRLEQRSKKTKTDEGKTETHRFVVPVLDPGITPGELLAATSPQTINVPRIGNGERPSIPAGPDPTHPPSFEKPVGELGPSAPFSAEPLEAPGGDEERLPFTDGAEGDAWMRRIHAMGRERGLDHAAIHQMAVEQFDVESLTDLDPLQRGKLRAALEAIPQVADPSAPAGEAQAVDTRSAPGSPASPVIEQPTTSEPTTGGQAPPAPSSTEQSVPASSPPRGSAPADTDIDAATQRVYQAARDHKIIAGRDTDKDWAKLDALALAALGDQPVQADPDNPTPLEAGLVVDYWNTLAVEIAAGLHDPQARPKGKA